ncbi:odorant receptor 33a-like [Sitodiplosis mosellana]|uniref:odorant receptor 33a-like n=1 Tax=Sitodiplosis mosellana TaxID=263140 RepID=UPI002445343F|nr:odorant receptor 33a-like [Sitodiplosis mosellana]
MVDRSVITSSVVVVVVKAIALFTTRKGLNEFLEIIKSLDSEIHDESHIFQMNKTIKIGHRLYISYLYPYISTCVLLVFQTIYSKPETRMWSSTYAYPFKWAQRTNVYVGGLFLQGIANTCIVLFAVAADTYGVVMLQILSTHIDILQDRLKCLGQAKELSSDEHFNQLISGCKTYENILRCSKLLESTLGSALFAQFCVSGVVLCTSAYQLTMIAPENFSKLSFVIVYFMCMMTEIFVPCFFGSVALEKSRLIGWKIYESNWMKQDKRYKQAFSIFIQRSSFPIHLTVNKIFFLDLSTFLKILKTAYSLFALLKNV